MDLTDIGRTGGAGVVGTIIGAFLSYLGFRGKVNGLKERVDSLSGSVRYADTCESRYEGVKEQLKDIKDMHAETRSDVKEILRRLPK